MVSKASEDFPEPDRPVNTTSRSRGISRSIFLRLCSRAPRIVIARIAEPVCWRFALITSSMRAIPDAQAYLRAHRGKTGSERQWEWLERRKNKRTFPAPRDSHQRFLAAEIATRVEWRAE